MRHPEGEKKFSVALLDYGAKGSICNSLLARGCEVTIYPYNTPAEDILAAGHDGVMLSNGPGDPADNPSASSRSKNSLAAAHVRHLPGPPDHGPGRRRKDQEAEVRPPRRQPARHGPGDRHRGHHQPEPRLRRGRNHPGRYGRENSGSSTSTTAPARASITPLTTPSPCSSTPRPTAAPLTP